MPEFINQFESVLSQRIKKVPRSFLRDILSLANAPEIISFAGGLPNKKYFPVEELKDCANYVLSTNAESALQYYSSEGLSSLRRQVSDIYEESGLHVNPEQIIITTGSQQALDIIGKVLIDRGDKLIIEEPAYLGAIQAFSMYEPDFISVKLELDGINIEETEKAFQSGAKLAYLVPNYQNPTGISYSEEKRQLLGELAKKYGAILIEDNPYGMLSFNGNTRKSICSYTMENTILLGTFSKILAPGLRVGWMVCPSNLQPKFIVAKQAADLHTDVFVQQIISRFLEKFNLKGHLMQIISAYGYQAKVMMKAIEEYFPDNIGYVVPQGGMFTWVTLPEGTSTMELFRKALQKKVAFVPGFPFYLNKSDINTLRLNFSCTEPNLVRKGIKQLSVAYNELLKENKTDVIMFR